MPDDVVRHRLREAKEEEAEAFDTLDRVRQEAAAARDHLASLQAAQAESNAIRWFAEQRPDVMDRISPVLGDLMKLRAEFPHLRPADQLAAAGLRPDDLGLSADDVPFIALIPCGRTD
ncbi:hypothetical protein [Streptomyces sp. NPDC046925]|uniref:hypothetical protein n=1 Tax=Streptomyces sp. NPDC046925 TaxID=3155375 RepID=UPI0033DF52FC